MSIPNCLKDSHIVLVDPHLAPSSLWKTLVFCPLLSAEFISHCMKNFSLGPDMWSGGGGCCGQHCPPVTCWWCVPQTPCPGQPRTAKIVVVYSVCRWGARWGSCGRIYGSSWPRVCRPWLLAGAGHDYREVCVLARRRCFHVCDTALHPEGKLMFAGFVLE